MYNTVEEGGEWDRGWRKSIVHVGAVGTTPGAMAVATSKRYLLGLGSTTSGILEASGMSMA